jgi:hypothetical protein
MIDTVVLTCILDRHDVLYVLHDAYGRMVATRGGADGTEFRIGDIMALAAIDNFFLKA